SQTYPESRERRQTGIESICAQTVEYIAARRPKRVHAQVDTRARCKRLHFFDELVAEGAAQFRFQPHRIFAAHMPRRFAAWRRSQRLAFLYAERRRTLPPPPQTAFHFH